MVVSWDPYPGAVKYQVRYRRALTTTWTNVITTNTSQVLQVLVQNKVYDYRVRTSCDGTSWSPMSPIDKFRTKQCLAPTGLSHIQLSNNKVRVEWSHYTYADKYQVWFRLAGSSDPWASRVTWDIGQNFRVLNNLIPGATYEWKVRSYCEVSYGPWTDLNYFTNNSTRLANEDFAINGLYPNPVMNELNIDFSLAEKSDVTFSITDMMGRTVAIQNETYGKGINKHILPVSELENGYYILHINNGKDVITKKFVKIGR